MDVLITGGTGFIGSVLARRLHGLGHRTGIFGQINNEWEARRAQDLADHGIRVAIGSVLEPPALAAALSGADTVVHLAAAQHESDVSDDYFREINVEGTRNVLETSVAAGVERVIHGSTIGVYGTAQTGPLDEQSPLEPENIYGITKLEGERVAAGYRDRLAITTVRISETYGPEDKRLLPMFRFVSKGWFPLIGSGANTHQPIFVDDLACALITLLENDESIGETVIVAGPTPVTTVDMISCVEKALGRPSRHLKIPMGVMSAAAFALEKGMPILHMKPPLTRRRLDFYRKSFWFDTAKAVRLTGAPPAIDFAAGARLTLQWYLANGLLVTIA